MGLLGDFLTIIGGSRDTARDLVVTPIEDADLINEVINHPAVRPFIGFADAGDLDITPLVRPENLFPFGEHGGFALLWSAPRTREVHTFILPKGRGAWARQAAADGIDIARSDGTRTLWTKIPDDQPNVRAFAVGMGMQPTGEVIETDGKPYAVYAMEIA